MWKFDLHVQALKAASHTVATKTGIYRPYKEIDRDYIFAAWLSKKIKAIADGDKSMTGWRKKREDQLKEIYSEENKHIIKYRRTARDYWSEQINLLVEQGYDDERAAKIANKRVNKRYPEYKYD